jgi:ribose 5-phosphate isomerase A
MAEERVDQFKKAAAIAAVDRISSGQVVGLGTGSTVRFAILELGERLRQGRLGDVLGIPTSEETAALAVQEGITLVEVGRSPMGLAIDGADEITPSLALTKGGGGALLREKIVAAAAYRFIVIADESKLVDRLGSTFPIPVEVARFGLRGTMDHLRRFGNPTLRTFGEEPFRTDNDNYIVDLQVEPVDHPARFNQLLSSLPGVLETGLFVGIADEALIAGPGGVRTVTAR